MIVEKSKPQAAAAALLLQQQQQQRMLRQPTLSAQRNQGQQHHASMHNSRVQFDHDNEDQDNDNNNLSATNEDVDDEQNEDEEGDNDEENIVIDMADEDDDDDEDDQDQDENEDNQLLDFGEQDNNEQLDSLIRFNNNNNQIQPKSGHFVSAYTNNNTNNTNTNNTNNARSNCIEGKNSNNNNIISTQHFNVGDLVWFDPNQYGYFIPGKVIDFYSADLSVLTVEGYAQPAPLALSAGDNLLINNQDNNSSSANQATTYELYNKLLLDADQELQLYELSDIEQFRSCVKIRLPIDEQQPGGSTDLIDLIELSQESILWNLKLRYKQQLVYTNCGQKILLSINPFKQLCDLYNLEQVNRYDNLTNSHKLRSLSNCCPNSIIASNDASLDGAHQCASGLIRWLLLHDNNNNNNSNSNKNTSKSDGKIGGGQNEPHIFRMANECLKKLLITGQDQCFVLLGESGSGKTEACKLLVQYFATVNKSPTNLMTEQILESIQVLESFGNAKTVHNDNSSRFGKLLEIRFNLNNSFILDAKTIDLNLLDRSRIVGQGEKERNYHIFYELLSGLSPKEKEKYGLQTAEKYFYLNQGHCVELQSKEDGDDFRSLLASMQVLGFNYEEQDTIFRLLASVLHLGNIYFHRKVLAVRSGKLAAANNKSPLDQHHQQSAGVEGVEIGSDTEVRWVSHLLQIQFDLVMRCLSTRTTEASTTVQSGDHSQVVVDRIVTPLNIDQALDTRDAIARTLYNCLFKWLIQRINVMINQTNSSQQTQANNEQKQQQQQQYQYNNSQEPVYLCRTSESLCEFQPNKLTHSSLSNSRQSTLSRRQSSSKKHHHQQLSSATITILDAFGFENLTENNFEQLCINYTAELLHYHTARYLLRLEQAEYARERLKWTNIESCFSSSSISNHQLAPHNSSTLSSTTSSASCPANGTHTKSSNADAVLNLISKKPRGILALLDDECNFPKASDQSFIEKCHHNHALDENYQRARLDVNCHEFGVRHFKQTSRLVWYQVDGFIEKNLDSLRPDIVELLVGSKMVIVADMLRKLHQAQDFSSSSANKTLSRTYDGRYVSMKPRATTVAARFQDALHNNRVLESINSSQPTSIAPQQVTTSSTTTNNTNSSETLQYHASCAGRVSGGFYTPDQQQQRPLKPNPWFVVCLKPNRSKSAQVFDVAYVQDQMRTLNLVEISQIRKRGFPIRLRYGEFLRRYKCLMPRRKFLSSAQAAEAEYVQQCAGATTNNQSSIRDECSSIIELKFAHQLELVRRQFQCGLTKVFLNEKLYDQLEQMRLLQHQRAILVLQKTFRMLPVRRDFLDQRCAITVIQSHWRAYLARREFWRQYMLIVYLQQKWRQQLIVRRRKRLEEKRRAQRQRQQQLLQQVQAQQRSLSNQLRFRVQLQPNQQRHLVGPSGSNYQAIARLNLDIPEDLAQLYRLQRNWIPAHDLTNVSELKLEQMFERERRRRARHLNNVGSVPFIVLDEDDNNKNENFESKSCKNQPPGGASSARISSKRRNKVMIVEQIISELELDERYSLDNMLTKFYPLEVAQFGYSRLPITRPFSWHQMARARHLALKQSAHSLRAHLKAAATLSNNNNNSQLPLEPMLEQRELEIKRRFNIIELKALAMYKLILRYIDSDSSSGADQQVLEHMNNDTMSLNNSSSQREQMQKLVKFKLIADYLIYLCITEPHLRDELYLQLISQSWQNPKPKSSENVWKLLVNCLSCFGPTDKELSRFLLKYTSDYCCDKYRLIALRRIASTLLSGVKNGQHQMAPPTQCMNLVRKFPPSMLEYWANQRAINKLALAATCYMDDHSLGGGIDAEPKLSEDLSITNYANKTLVEIEPRTSAEELAAAALRARKVPEANLAGWSVEIQHEGAQSEQSCRLRGDDQLLDHFARLEMLPEFRQLIEATGECESESWLAQEEQQQQQQQQQQVLSRDPASHYHAPSSGQYQSPRVPQQHHVGAGGGQRQMLRRKLSLSETSSGRPTNTNRFSVVSSDLGGMAPGAGNNSQRHSYISTSSNRSMPPTPSMQQPELERAVASRLSQTSKLNRRYMRDQLQATTASGHLPDNDHTHQYYHYQDPMVSGNYAPHSTVVPGGGTSQGRRLNRRSMSMQELQLASSSALNGRYFGAGGANQNQIMPAASSVAGGNHYASSYVQAQHKQQQHSSSRAAAAGSLQQLTPTATPTNQMRRRSQTPNSTLMSSSSSAATHRVSSSAYGSESPHHLSPFVAGHSLDPQQQQHRLSRLEMLESSGGARAGRRSASSSSRAPRSLMGFATNNHTPAESYATSGAYSDYERIGGQQSRGYATPTSNYGYAPAPQLKSRGQRSVQPLVERNNYRAPPTAASGGGGQQQRRRVQHGAYSGKQQQHLQKGAAPFVDEHQVAYQQQQSVTGAKQAPVGYAGRDYVSSSAMSDTSEAPSLASHVRAIKVPQHNGDLDQYLDDLFNPMLDDAELDELSDARSLATSIRGSHAHFCDPKKLSQLIRGTDDDDDADNDAEIVNATFSPPATNAPAWSMNESDEDVVGARVETTLSPTFESLLKSLKSDPLATGANNSSLATNEHDEQQASSVSAGGGTSTAPIMSQLGKLNLSELKALNEKLEQEIEAAQQSRSGTILGAAAATGMSVHSECSASIPAPPPQPSFGAPMEDIYSRAKTVRIGKWRWPPARDETTQQSCTVGADGATTTSTSNENELTTAKLAQGNDDEDADQQIINYFESKEKRRLSQLSSSLSSGGHISSGATPLIHQPQPTTDSGEYSTSTSTSNSMSANSSSNVGKLKISSEMKAKLEQLTTTSSGGGNTTAATSSPSPATPTPSSSSAAGLVRQIKSLLDAATSGDQQVGATSGGGVKRLGEQRRNLLENQLAGSSSSSVVNSMSSEQQQQQQKNPASASNRSSIESTGSKVQAAKQQLAAAAGVALTALDNSSSNNISTSQQVRVDADGSTGDNEIHSSLVVLPLGATSGGGSGNISHAHMKPDEACARNSRAMQDELGPQSRAAISQRQAFYQMSASSDQLDALSQQQQQQLEHANSEHQLSASGRRRRDQVDEIPPPSPPPNVALSSDNLSSSAHAQLTAATSGQCAGSSSSKRINNHHSGAAQLTRSIQMAANLNEIGQANCEFAKESERLYGQSIAKSLSQRQQESLKRVSGERRSRARATTNNNSNNIYASTNTEQHQWVSSSPDRTLESSLKRRAKRTSDQEKATKTRRLSSQQQQQSQSQLVGQQQQQSQRHLAAQKQQQDKSVSLQANEQDSDVCVAYANVDWQIKIRKEFFLPSETYDNELVVQLIFAQLVADVFNPRHWTRLNNKERSAIKALMKDNSIGYSSSLPQIGQMQDVKRDLVRMARSFGLYFTRSYPATNFALIYSDPNHNLGLSSLHACPTFNDQCADNDKSKRRMRRRRSSSVANSASASESSQDEESNFEELESSKDQQQACAVDSSEAVKLMVRLRNANNLGSDWIDLVAVHHSGLRLVALVAGEQQQPPLLSPQVAPTDLPTTPTPPFGYRVLETLKFRDMTNVSQVGACELLVSMRNGKKCWLISSSQVSEVKCVSLGFKVDGEVDDSTSGESRGRRPSGRQRLVPLVSK